MRTRCDPDLAVEGAAAFQTLVDAIVWQQREGMLRDDDPQQLARYIWSIVHGISMLALDDRLRSSRDEVDDLVRFAVERIRGGIDAAKR